MCIVYGLNRERSSFVPDFGKINTVKILIVQPKSGRAKKAQARRSSILTLQISLRTIEHFHTYDKILYTDILKNRYKIDRPDLISKS